MTATEIQAKVLSLDMAHLTQDDIKWLHDLKAEAIKGWAAQALAELKTEHEAQTSMWGQKRGN